MRLFHSKLCSERSKREARFKSLGYPFQTFSVLPLFFRYKKRSRKRIFGTVARSRQVSRREQGRKEIKSFCMLAVAAGEQERERQSLRFAEAKDVLRLK